MYIIAIAAFAVCGLFSRIHIFSISLLIVYSVHRQAIDNLWIRCSGLKAEDVESGETQRRRIISLVTFAVVLALSLAVPNLVVVVPILGSAAAVLMFIIPGRVYGTNTNSKGPTLI